MIIDSGPSFSTRREEARAGFEAFMRAAPTVAPLLLDLYARAQDWPFAPEVAERIEAMLPAPVQAVLQRARLRSFSTTNWRIFGLGTTPPKTMLLR